MSSAAATRLLLLGAGELAQRQAEADILGDVHVREQRVVLEHGVDRPVERPERRDVAAFEQHACRSIGLSKPAMTRRLVVLPQPDGPSRRQELAARDVEIDGVEADDAARKNLGDRLAAATSGSGAIADLGRLGGVDPEDLAALAAWIAEGVRKRALEGEAVAGLQRVCRRRRP